MLELSVGRCGIREGIGDVGGPPRDPLKGALPLPLPLPFHGANVKTTQVQHTARSAQSRH